MTESRVDALMFVAREGALKVAERMEDPNADWQPVLLLFTDDQKHPDVPVFIAVNELFQNGGEDFVNLAPYGMRGIGATDAVLVVNMWSATFDREEWEENDGLDAEAAEERKIEVVAIAGASADGSVRASLFPVIRHEDKPPELSDPMDMHAMAVYGIPLLAALRVGVGALPLHEEE